MYNGLTRSTPGGSADFGASLRVVSQGVGGGQGWRVKWCRNLSITRITVVRSVCTQCNAVAGIIGTLFLHMEAFEIVMFNNIGARIRLLGKCNAAESHCLINNQVLECEVACVVFT